MSKQTFSLSAIIGQPHAVLAQTAPVEQSLTNINDTDHVLGAVLYITRCFCRTDQVMV